MDLGLSVVVQGAERVYHRLVHPHHARVADEGAIVQQVVNAPAGRQTKFIVSTGASKCMWEERAWQVDLRKKETGKTEKIGEEAQGRDKHTDQPAHHKGRGEGQERPQGLEIG